MASLLPATDRASSGFWKTLRRQYAPVPFFTHQMGCALKSGKEGPTDQERLRRINELAPELAKRNVDSLAALARQALDEVRAGRPLEETLDFSFALVREMSRRLLGLFPYDVQILGGLALARGAIAEMATGEGKTLVQLLPAFYFGLTGKGVHVATANGYLAERDHAFGQPVYEALGLTSALLPERVPPFRKRQAYLADVTYGTGSEFGFDYLRDQLALLRQPELQPGEKLWNDLLGRKSQSILQAQRGLHVAIIDEADAILIDEAVTPLLISGRNNGENPDSGLYLAARDLLNELEEGVDFETDATKRQANLTEGGHDRIHQMNCEIDRNLLKRPWYRYVENALRAQFTLTKDRHYLVRDDSILIIDEFTGRVKEGSSWRDGLHQAVEAKEGLPINCESESQASISRQKFYRLYDRVCGMTGTGLESAGEFWQVYQLPVVPIPRNKPCRQQLQPPRVFAKSEHKLIAAVAEIRRLHQLGQPVLVGTRTIENSERLSGMLTRAEIPHQLLNANQDQSEAEVIAAAGQPHAVTISTNMAGRGTHIDLGEGVEELGGLHVMVIEIDESQRIDRQLLGRAARQGKPGSGQIFLSLEDHLISRFAPELAERLLEQHDSADWELPGKLARQFERIQTIAEVQAYQNRLATMEQDRWNDETKLRVA